MNPDLQRLQPYPFEKIRQLLVGTEANAELDAILLSLGEPKHATPSIIHDAICDNLSGIASYPLSKGTQALRESIAGWLERRFQLNEIDADQHILPVNGTREALFAFAQAVIDRQQTNASVLMPNPFYQIYEGATFLAGAEPVFLNCTNENDFQPDFEAIPEAVWQACQLLFICTPGNPTGATLTLAQLKLLINLADKHDFIIASDECYSELYFDEQQPPPGLLQAAAELGNDSYKHCVVFHSLSKRSNAPGMRSGFIAGDAAVLKQFLQYRTYHGCAMPPIFQAASIAAWNDEQHVIENRAIYRRKFNTMLDVLKPVMNVSAPDAGFYLWPETPIDDKQFTRGLFTQQAVHVVPGSYLSREADGINPGANRVRMALVAPEAECETAAQRIRQFIEQL